MGMEVAILQRIADHVNWLTDDERNAVSEKYNAVANLFMVLERTLINTLGSDKVVTIGSGCVENKSVYDFCRWSSDGADLARLFEDLLKFGSLKYLSDEDKETLEKGAETIRNLGYAMLETNVTVKKG